MPTKFYITTPIYYVNDMPHIGHAYTSLACDVLARCLRSQYGSDNVFLLTGTDEHGQKIEKSAVAKKENILDFCNKNAKKFEELCELMNISNNDFIRTTSARHIGGAKKFWNKLEENGFIYKGTYEGWYAIRDEAFYSENELIEGKAPTGAEVIWQKEESYFFRLSAFQRILEFIYKMKPNFVKPDSRRNEVMSFVRGGSNLIEGALQDLSISRTSFSWGIHIDNDQKHVMYVWLDALTNYLTALGYGSDKDTDLRQFWHQNNTEKVHIVGKDILRFHAVYWPAFLLAESFSIHEIEKMTEEIALDSNKNDIVESLLNRLPSQIFAHGWWTNEGQKISKSLGNVIDPIKLIEEFGLDQVRYFLMREVSFGEDGNFSKENMIKRINSDLANNLGNLVQRTLSMVKKYLQEESFIVNQQDINLVNNKMVLDSQDSDIIMNKVIQDKQFHLALGMILENTSIANEYIEQTKPWQLQKEGKVEELKRVLYTILDLIRKAAILLMPFMPNATNKILDQLGIDNNLRNIINLHDDKVSYAITGIEPIFLKIC